MTAKDSARRPAKKAGARRLATGSIPEASRDGKMLFAVITKRLKTPSKQRVYIPPDQIARALRENTGIPLPPEIHDYLCDFLEGKIQAPAGRPADIKNPIAQIRKALIPPTYARYLAWLKLRKRSMGLEGWEPIRDADWWQGPPNERAARMTCRRWGLAMDWRRVQNIVSEANK